MSKSLKLALSLKLYAQLSKTASIEGITVSELATKLLQQEFLVERKRILLEHDKVVETQLIGLYILLAIVVTLPFIIVDMCLI